MTYQRVNIQILGDELGCDKSIDQGLFNNNVIQVLSSWVEPIQMRVVENKPGLGRRRHSTQTSFYIPATHECR